MGNWTARTLALGLALACSLAPAPAGAEGRPLLLLGDKDYPPHTYLEGQEARGMDIDLAQALARALGRPVQVELLEWSEAQQRVLEGSADGLVDLGISEQRRLLYDFSEPTNAHEFGLFVRAEEVAIDGLRDLVGRRVGVTPGGFPRAFLTSLPSVELVPIANYADGFAQLAQGRIDAVAADRWVAAYLIQERHLRGIRSAGAPFITAPAGIAVRKGNTALVNELNRALLTLQSEGTLERIRQRWRPHEMLFLSRERLVHLGALAATGVLLLVLGALALWVATLKRQIRSRKAAEAALLESQQRFLVASSIAQIGTWRWSAVTEQSTRDANANRMFGMEAKESSIPLRALFSRLHPEDQDATRQSFERAIREGVDFSAEYRVAHPDGAVRWFHGLGRPFYGPGGEISHMTGAVVDITDQKRAEAELRKERDFTRTLVQACPAYFVALSPERRVVMMNEAMLKAVGRSAEEVVGLDYLATFVAEEDRERVAGVLDRLRQRPDATVSTNRVLGAEGRPLLVEWSGRSIFKPDGTLDYYLRIGTDISERSRLEAQLLQAQKMESVGRLAGGIAHDFNNILMVINGYSDFLLRHLEGEDLREQAQEIRSAGQRATDLTRQLLAFSRRQVIQPRPVRLNALIAEARNMLARLVGEDVELVTRLEAGEDLVLADPSQLNQVLMNLTVNARDAMPKGGRLELHTCNVGESEDLTTGRRTQPCVLLSVRDTGTGFDAETGRHIFEPFFTTKEPGKGTGLGLSTVYGIVRQSGGALRFESRPGAGTTFHIYLPCTGDRAGERAPARAEAGELRGSATVLVAEDQESVRRFTAEVLRSYGYQVLEAASGREALALVERHPGALHLVVADLVMPGMDGPELVARLGVLRPGLRALFMSGYADEALGPRGLETPGLDYLAKPFSPEVLAIKVRQLSAEAGRPGPWAGRAEPERTRG